MKYITDFAFPQSTASFPLKSILKPTVPVSPVRNIPSFEETRRRTPARGDASNQKPNHADSHDSNNEGLLIDFATPQEASVAGTENLTNPFDDFNATSAVREEMAATRERDERERRERERQSILEKREARRKSMGLSSILRTTLAASLILDLNSKSASFVCPRSHIAHLERGGDS